MDYRQEISDNIESGSVKEFDSKRTWEDSKILNLEVLMENGFHYGHTRKNPNMAPYIYGVKGGVQIIDLTKTLPLMRKALSKIESVVAGGGKILIVGTKPQASLLVKEAAESCAQHYINVRWLCGTLTNWETIKGMVKKTDELRLELENSFVRKEKSRLTREINKYEKLVGGIATLDNLPNLVVILDASLGTIALKEANKMRIPVVAVFDSNTNPNLINPETSCMIPANDDSVMSISLFLKFVVNACLCGLERDVRRTDDSERAAAEKEKKVGVKRSFSRDKRFDNRGFDKNSKDSANKKQVKNFDATLDKTDGSFDNLQ